MPNLFARREFLGRTAVAAGALGLSLLPGLAAPPAVVPVRRLKRLAKGANVAKWFRFLRAETPEHFKNYLSEAEVAMMARMGLTHVRLCVAPKIIMDAGSGEVREENAAYLDAAIERFQRAGLLVVVDIHNEDRPSELNPAWQEAFIRFWSALAKRLAHLDPDLTVLEIINEPVFSKRELEWDT